MLVAERLLMIERIVNERGSIRVTELSELCQVTEETIRRDLDKLESESKLMRSHGGAVSIKPIQQEVPYAEREVMNRELKRQIAQEAIRHIVPRERIALDASSTALYVATLLPDMPLTVLTNSIKVALELSSKPQIEVISTGGLLARGSLSYTGPLAERAVSTYFVDKAFISCKGIHASYGISDSSEGQAMLKRRMVEMTENVYVLADSSKFCVRAFAQITGWDSVTHLITDDQAKKEELEWLQEWPVQLHIAT